MAKKKINMTLTSRHFIAAKPWVVMMTPNPYPNPPRNRRPIIRLGFDTPAGKGDCTCENFARTINESALDDAIFIPDTSFFKDAVDDCVWDALCRKHIAITPMVWEELNAWKNDPHNNRGIRNLLLHAEQCRGGEQQYVNEVLYPVRQALGTPCYRRIEFLQVDESYKEYGYDHYFNLLGLRKRIGPLLKDSHEKKNGGPLTPSALESLFHNRFGLRGKRLALRGIEKAGSPNLLTDEQLVVMAAQTAIMRGSEVFILTRDEDLQEQFMKLMYLLSGDYRGTMAADYYNAFPDCMNFTNVAVNEKNVPFFVDGTVKVFYAHPSQLKMTLPQNHHFVTVNCLLFGGDRKNLKMTPTIFCAETEMALLLKIKAATGGKNTPHFGENNCTIGMVPVPKDGFVYGVFIGKEKQVTVGGMDMTFSDYVHTLTTHELVIPVLFSSGPIQAGAGPTSPETAGV